MNNIETQLKIITKIQLLEMIKKKGQLHLFRAKKNIKKTSLVLPKKNVLARFKKNIID